MTNSKSHQCDNKTYKFEHIPVEDIIVREALSVEEVSEELAEIRVVGLVIKSQRAAEIQVCGKLRCGEPRRQESSLTHGLYCRFMENSSTKIIKSHILPCMHQKKCI